MKHTKKYLAMVLVFVAVVTLFICKNSFGYVLDTDNGFAVDFNGEQTGYTSIIRNGTHYVPLRDVFEKMGSAVFYRNSDRQILALSRDGDEIRHFLGDNKVTVNGTEKTFTNPSVTENGQTYIPLEMVSTVFYPAGTWWNNQCVYIRKQFLTNDFHGPIEDVLKVSKGTSFNPEKFKKYIALHAKNPSMSLQDVVFRVNIGLDSAFYEDVATISNPDDLSVLVNKHNRIPSGFTPKNLVNMARGYTVNDGKEYLLSKPAYEWYVKMSDAAAKEGLSMKVISAYRTEAYQSNLYNNKLRTTGKTNADNYSARPGFSEHQTGLAVDICSTSGSFEYTSEFKWLQKNAHKYGFILRYPKGKEWITGYSYEPWHYRYVGVYRATEIHNLGITYEEYYANYVAPSEFK